MPSPEEFYELDRDCPRCIYCGDTGEVFGHADDCTDDHCALNGDMHSCAGKVEPCHCAASTRGTSGGQTADGGPGTSEGQG